MRYLLQDTSTETIEVVLLERLLAIINNHRNAEWIDYDATDWREGWEEWEEGDYFKLLGEVA
jgi:hypothetical protein